MKKILPLIISALILLSGCVQSSRSTSVSGSTESESPYVKEIVTSFTANFILTSDGNVYSWGENEQGVLGLGKELGAKVSFPQKVLLDEPIKKLVTSSLANTVFAISESGTVYGWGGNLYKTISDDEVPTYNLPIQIKYDVGIAEIALSHHIVTVLSNNGDVYGYGWDQMGDGVHDEGDSFRASNHNLRKIELPTGSQIAQFANSESSRVFLTKSGEVYIQGAFVSGRMLYDNATQIVFPEPIIKIGAMTEGMVGLSNTGKLYFAGQDRFGIVGYDTSEYYEVYNEPILVNKTTEKIIDFSASLGSIIIRTVNNDFFTWGYNLGKNNAASSDEVIVIPNRLEIASDSPIIYYHCGEFSSAYITEDHSVYVWGSNVQNIFLDEAHDSSYHPKELVELDSIIRTMEQLTQ